MKYFAFRIDELSRDRNGVATKRCTLYSVRANVLKQVAQRDYTFESDDQAAVNTAVRANLVPSLLGADGTRTTSPRRYEDSDVAKFMQV